MHAHGVGAAITEQRRPSPEKMRFNERLREAHSRIPRLLGPIHAWRGGITVICYACETHYPVSIRAIGASAANTCCPACGAPWHVILDSAAIETKAGAIQVPVGGALSRRVAQSTLTIGNSFTDHAPPATSERKLGFPSLTSKGGPILLTSAQPGYRPLAASFVSIISVVGVVALLGSRDIRDAAAAWWRTANIYGVTAYKGNEVSDSDAKRQRASVVPDAGQSKQKTAEPLAGATAIGSGAEHAVTAVEAPVITAPAAGTRLSVAYGEKKARSRNLLYGRRAARSVSRRKHWASAYRRLGHRRR